MSNELISEIPKLIGLGMMLYFVLGALGDLFGMLFFMLGGVAGGNERR